MKKFLLILVILLASSARSSAQTVNGRYDNIAISNAGTFLQAAPLATVTVCASTGTGIPCTPKASICINATDVSCTVPNPFTTDINGNFGFWAPPGTYIVTINGTNVSSSSLIATIPPLLVNSILATNNTFSGTNTFNAVTTLSNYTTTGTGTHNGSEAFNGSNTFAGTSVFSNTATLNSGGTFLGTVGGNHTYSGNVIHNGTNTFNAAVTFTGGGSTTGTLNLGSTALSANNPWTGNESHSGTETFGNLNNTIYVGEPGVANTVAAIAAAPTGGMVVWPPGYTETITSTITVGKALTLVCNACALTASSVNPAFNTTASNVAFLAVNGGSLTLIGGSSTSGFTVTGTVSNYTIDGWKIIGDGVVGDGQQAIYNNSGQTLTNVRYTNNTISGVILGISVNADLAGSINGFLVSGNYLTNIVGTTSGSGYGIHHANGSGNPSYGRIVNNYIELAQRHSIYQAKGSGVVIIGNVTKQHRHGVSSGVQASDIVVARSTDILVEGNSSDRPEDGWIEVDSDTGFPARNVIVKGNVCVNPLAYPALTIGTGNNANGIPEEVTIEGNSIYQDVSNGGGLSVQLFIQEGKRIQVLGNFFYFLNVTNTNAIAQIAGTGEGAGTASFTDELTFKNNFFYGTNNGGAVYAFQFNSAAATSGIRADFVSNRVNTPSSNTFNFLAGQTDANIFVTDTLTNGLTASLLSATPNGRSSFAGQIVSTVSTGTAPFSIASTTIVPNLNVQIINGVTLTGTPSAGQIPTATSSSAASWATPAGLFTGVNVTPVTVNTNTSSDQNVMAITITAGALNSVNRTLLIQLAGVYSTPASSTTTLTHKLKLCTISGCGSGTVITLASWTSSALGVVQATNNPYNVTLNSTTQTAGGSAAFEAHGNLAIDLAALASAAEAIFADNNTATVGTIDSTAQLFLQHTISFSAASGSNSATDRQMIADTVD